jgi:hypothetical protein
MTSMFRRKTRLSSCLYLWMFEGICKSIVGFCAIALTPKVAFMFLGKGNIGKVVPINHAMKMYRGVEE